MAFLSDSLYYTILSNSAPVFFLLGLFIFFYYMPNPDPFKGVQINTASLDDTQECQKVLKIPEESPNQQSLSRTKTSNE
jgi:hypothetical protein